ncbi:hypothetical protein LCGC14_2264780, partial [marine sediment metagenome]
LLDSELALVTSPDRARRNAERLLGVGLKRKISEPFFNPIDPETGEDRMGTKAEALVRNMWKMALGYTEQRVVGDDLKDFSFSPDKGMMSRIFDRIEGKVPMTATIDKQKATAAERLTKENTKRLNKVGGFGATADANREI